MSVVIVDNGGANMNSLVFALQRLGAPCKLSAERRALYEATHVILPGVGHAGDSMNKLNEKQLITSLKELGTPVLGICLGMQLLYRGSDEGDTHCLGLVDGQITKLHGSTDYPVPHMGWNQIEFEPTSALPLLEGIEPGSYMYFVHGFVAPITQTTIATTHYQRPFTSIMARDNFYGVQFHPERSGSLGAKLLANFLSLP